MFVIVISTLFSISLIVRGKDVLIPNLIVVTSAALTLISSSRTLLRSVLVRCSMSKSFRQTPPPRPPPPPPTHPRTATPPPTTPPFSPTRTPLHLPATSPSFLLHDQPLLWKLSYSPGLGLSRQQLGSPGLQLRFKELYCACCIRALSKGVTAGSLELPCN